jgi:anthranilate phosphoribosyltransferase
MTAGAALLVADKAKSLKQGVELAQEAIANRHAEEVLATLVRVSNA